jgi:hypothetical protein
MLRVPVLDKNNRPLMPTLASRARRWLKEGKAIGKFNKLGQFYVQLQEHPSNNKTQPIAIGIDPGKLFSGIGVQSALHTLAGITYTGWCSGDTAFQVSVSDFNWKRLGQFTASKVELLQRSTGLICKQETVFVGATG